MSYLVFCCKLSIWKLEWVDYLGWGKKILYFRYQSLVSMWLLFGSFLFLLVLSIGCVILL